MRKYFIKVSVFLVLLGFLPLQSCIGNFTLTKKVLNWNNQVGSKFLNELVFFAFWILPVYEVTAVADLLVINSIEFWSGNNPVDSTVVQEVSTDHGIYYIATLQNGYKITDPDGHETILEFTEEDQTWSVRISDEEVYPFMTMIDESHVKMITPDGSFRLVELNEQGLSAYCNLLMK